MGQQVREEWAINRKDQDTASRALDSNLEMRETVSKEKQCRSANLERAERVIGKHERVAVALRTSEERFRTLADAIPQLCWTANADGWILWYNQRWYDFAGKTPEEMEGWGWQSVHDPAALPVVLAGWKKAIRAGEPFEMVFTLRAADRSEEHT